MASSLHPAQAHRFLAESARLSAPRPLSRLAPIALALRLSRALLVVSGIIGLVSVGAPAIFHDAPAYAGNAIGTYVVVLLVALPTLALAMRAATRGSLRAHFVWLGTLCYLLYAAVLASFSLRFNELFLLYVASLSLAVASLVALLRCLPADELPARLSARLPVRAVGGYLVVIGVAFAALWSMDVLPALVSGDVPRSLQGTSLPTNAVQVLDFGFTLPLCVAGGLWLMRRRPWGILLSGMLLVFLTLESVSVAVDQWFGHRADSFQPMGAVAAFLALAVVGSLPMFGFLRAVDAPDVRAPRG
ncbi:MAG TPA: hypothetical protein VF461_08235 [Gemmatimonadaceae bacterium]